MHSTRTMDEMKELISSLLIILKRSFDISVYLVETGKQRDPSISVYDDEIGITVYNDEELYRYIEGIIEQ